MTDLGTPVRTAWSARGWAVYLGWVVITLDGSALNLALPTIAKQLQAQDGGISWVVDAYTLPLASLLLLGGSLGDRLGVERLFRVGAVGFAAASVACALSPAIGVLIVCRAAQGVFAALLVPMLLALVGKSFTDPRHRSSAVNLMTVFGGVGMAAGPFLGGLLTDTVGWRAVFWLTAPIAIAAASLVGPADQEYAAHQRFRFDTAGQITGTAGLVALAAGLIEAGNDTPGGLVWALLAAGVVLLGAFVVIEHRSITPMMPLKVFRSAGFTGAVIGGFAFQFGAYGLQFFLAVHLQAAWGVSALTGGLLLVSFAVGVVLASAIVNPYLLPRGTRPMILIGSAAAAFGTLALLGATGAERWWLLVAAEFMIGAGTGIYSTGLNKTASTSLGAQNAGLASGIYNTARQVGQSVGIAVLGAFAVAHDGRAGYLAAIALVACCAAAIAATELRVRRAAFA
ncbi:MFS transporter [Amycolatopsis jiangsuensis]|uniref:MFS family permease n=1 Tax=Amycolatopsis jiangsuensis TaxID=1181879 RepID=A0A840J1Y8_9PSEU|nr:MFS transporter [Amycolatopsis jiangsuensis]MBB4688070.1 MFS family permease [Amycolatopsis jiangsuensis]